MPILNGLELIERASHIDSRITFILLSGYGEFEYAKQAMKYGVRYYLLKPTDKQELISCLDTIREEKSKRDTAEGGARTSAEGYAVTIRTGAGYGSVGSA